MSVHHKERFPTDEISTTLAEQKQLLEKPNARKVLARPKADSVLMMVQRDSAFFVSRWTDNLSKLSRAFRFDTEVLYSRVYERVFLSSLKQLVRPQRSPTATSFESTLASTRSFGEYYILLGNNSAPKTDVENSMLLAIEYNPIALLTIPNTEVKGLLGLESRTAPLAFLYPIELKRDLQELEASVKYLATFQTLSIPMTSPLFMFFFDPI